ncbi:Protein CBG06505 [Caenorhabditis briggsae]|uniref:Protein CBG06505 n=2 Tax=Caenorhabditis briggsae TaxID=6238 RepID=A8X2D9_CAEBR|nr:Protein CBG06505 [Caenorhabditis briggsae]CAP26799.2 Protein CBG06505 [Caenorhabditis briggsae]
MGNLTFQFITLLLVPYASALDCTQIWSSDIRDGNTVNFPKSDGSMQTLPGNFNCVYNISAPTNSTNGIYAIVTLKNGLQGANDYILVKKITGTQQKLVSSGNKVETFKVIPGSQLSVQVVTKSVVMNSQFAVSVEYHGVVIGPKVQMKTGGEMNYLDVKTINHGSDLFSSVTYVSMEHIVLTLAGTEFDYHYDSNVYDTCYFIDGTFENQRKIYEVDDFAPDKDRDFTTIAHHLTIVSLQEKVIQVVLNPVSEVQQFDDLYAVPVTNTSEVYYTTNNDAYEFVNFDSVGIVMEVVKVITWPCRAIVVNGPPNAESKVLLSLDSNPTKPQIFNVKYLTVVSYECIQIPDSVIFDDSTTYIPGKDGSLQTIPANFNCVYNISVPTNSTDGLYAVVTVLNGLKGVNDFMLVTETTGKLVKITSSSDFLRSFKMVPGSQMSVQVVTKSVQMNSQFEITVQYHAAIIGDNLKMKTGGEMNFVDVTAIGDSSRFFNSVTYTGTEPILVTLATDQNSFDGYTNCYVIDGTIENQVQVYQVDDLLHKSRLTTTSKSVTIVSFDELYFQFVLNPISEAAPFTSLTSSAIKQTDDYFYLLGNRAVEFVNFNSVGILMDNVRMDTEPCNATVVSGPPNNSSKILLDLSTYPLMPQNFNVKYFTIISHECRFEFSVRASNWIE